MLFGRIPLTRGAKTSEFAALAVSWIIILVGIILANLGVIQGSLHTWLLANAPQWLVYEPTFWLVARSLLKYIETITSNAGPSVTPVPLTVTDMPPASLVIADDPTPIAPVASK